MKGGGIVVIIGFLFIAASLTLALLDVSMGILTIPLTIGGAILVGASFYLSIWLIYQAMVENQEMKRVQLRSIPADLI